MPLPLASIGMVSIHIECGACRIFAYCVPGWCLQVFISFYSSLCCVQACVPEQLMHWVLACFFPWIFCCFQAGTAMILADDFCAGDDAVVGFVEQEVGSGSDSSSSESEDLDKSGDVNMDEGSSAAGKGEADESDIMQTEEEIVAALQQTSVDESISVDTTPTLTLDASSESVTVVKATSRGSAAGGSKRVRTPRTRRPRQPRTRKTPEVMQ